MSKYQVQFHKDMSLQQFVSEFGSEEHYRKAVYQMLWPHRAIVGRCIAAGRRMRLGDQRKDVQ